MLSERVRGVRDSPVEDEPEGLPAREGDEVAHVDRVGVRVLDQVVVVQLVGRDQAPGEQIVFLEPAETARPRRSIGRNGRARSGDRSGNDSPSREIPAGYGEVFKQILEYLHSTISEIKRAPKPFVAAVERGAVLACQFGMAAFAVPYFFVYDPSILGLNVTWVQIVLSFITAIAGGICASVAMLGYFSARINVIERLLFALAAVLFMNSDWRIDLAAVDRLVHHATILELNVES